MPLVAVDETERVQQRHEGRSINEPEDGDRLAHVASPFADLEAEVLQRLGRPPVEPSSSAVVAALGSEIAESHPSGRTVASRAELFEAPIGSAQDFFSLVQVILLEEGSAQHELGVADLV